MKVIVIGLLIAIFMVVEAEKRCRESHDCEPDECCVARYILGFQKGDCKKLAAEGKLCSEGDDVLNFYHKQYISSCPCATGLSCEPTKVENIPFVGTVRYNNRCTIANQTTTVTSDQSSSVTPGPSTIVTSGETDATS